MLLRSYQSIAADFLFANDRAMILAPVGAGKTAITLTAMREMLREGTLPGSWCWRLSVSLSLCGKKSARSGRPR